MGRQAGSESNVWKETGLFLLFWLVIPLLIGYVELFLLFAIAEPLGDLLEHLVDFGDSPDAEIRGGLFIHGVLMPIGILPPAIPLGMLWRRRASLRAFVGVPGLVITPALLFGTFEAVSLAMELAASNNPADYGAWEAVGILIYIAVGFVWQAMLLGPRKSW